MKIGEKLKLADPSYRRGYVDALCMGCASLEQIMRYPTNDWIRSDTRHKFLCRACEAEGRSLQYKLIIPRCYQCMARGNPVKIAEFILSGAEYLCGQCKASGR